MGMLLVSFFSSHDYLVVKEHFDCEIYLHQSKYFCTKIYTHSPYNTLKVVCKFEVGSLNLHYLSGKERLFKTGKGFTLQKTIMYHTFFLHTTYATNMCERKKFCPIKSTYFLALW